MYDFSSERKKRKNQLSESSEIEKERGVVLAEIRTSKDDIEDLTFKKVNEIAFDKSSLFRSSKKDVITELSLNVNLW